MFRRLRGDASRVDTRVASNQTRRSSPLGRGRRFRSRLLSRSLRIPTVRPAPDDPLGGIGVSACGVAPMMNESVAYSAVHAYTGEREPRYSAFESL